MPVLSKTKMPFENTWYDRIVKVDARGSFTINLPPQVAAAVDVREVKGRTLSEAEGLAGDQIEKYRKTKRTTMKVIAYEYKCTAYITDPPAAPNVRPAVTHNADDEEDEFSDYRVLLYEQGISFTNGLALSLEAGVFEETATVSADGKSTVYRYKKIQSTIPIAVSHRLKPCGPDRAEPMMPWTEEREAFFTKIGLALSSLVLQLHQATEDETKLRKLIDSGQAGRLLLPGSVPATPVIAKRKKA